MTAFFYLIPGRTYLKMAKRVLFGGAQLRVTNIYFKKQLGFPFSDYKFSAHTLQCGCHVSMSYPVNDGSCHRLILSRKTMFLKGGSSVQCTPYITLHDITFLTFKQKIRPQSEYLNTSLKI